MSAPAFAGRRALGCVTYLLEEHEITIFAVGSIEQKWTKNTPLLIDAIEWEPTAGIRIYTLRDSQGSRRIVPESHLAEPLDD